LNTEAILTDLVAKRMPVTGQGQGIRRSRKSET
jgi:hypothetical protein